ncbi:MAG TPA: GC-type dockerin domain-anchored protein [Phycisphaerales bacterium]|nr:GC-type dockerin domain-anchored protein [Phycisphaerales bacterium]
MRNDPAGKAIIVATAVGALSALVQGQTFEFTISPHASSLAANLGFDAQTTGTLTGDWIADANPGGTRTKPGLLGAFGPAENVPVDVALGLSLGGDIDGATSGSFRITLDAASGEIGVEGFDADLLAGGTPSLPALLSVEAESFRTRQPDSAYPGVPTDLPAGEFRLTDLSLAQVPGPVSGAMTELEPDRFGFTLVAPAVLNAAFDLNGWPVEIAAPTELMLAGEITVSGGAATLTAVHWIDHAELQQPGVPLPQFPMELPTVLPPGATAHVLVDLALDEVATSIVGRLVLSAEGVVGGCDADFNSDGAANTLDVIAFLGAWSAHDLDADFNGDAAVNSLDVVDFLNAWARGC